MITHDWRCRRCGQWSPDTEAQTRCVLCDNPRPDIAQYRKRPLTVGDKRVFIKKHLERLKPVDWRYVRAVLGFCVLMVLSYGLTLMALTLFRSKPALAAILVMVAFCLSFLAPIPRRPK